MAAQAPRLESKRRVDYIALEARSYLTRCDSPRMPFRWTLNPYRGCEFGCRYCYARYTHQFMELADPQEFEQKIFVKSFNSGRLLEQLRQLKVGESLAIGTATDPYQPAERRFGLTRRMLEVIARTDGLRVGLVTKSDLVARDADLLAEIARRHYLTVHLTITTVDAPLTRLLEPLTPRAELRLRAVRALSAAGIHVTVFCAPVLPWINDSEAALDAVAAAAAEAGARGFGASVVFLKPCAQEVFFPFLQEHFPALAPRYRRQFAHSAFLRGAYPEQIRERVARVRARHRLLEREPLEPELWPRAAQLDLFV